MGPKKVFTIEVVTNVETTICEELKTQTRAFLLTYNDEDMPSTAAIKTAASPPYNIIVRKMSVSPTVTSPLTRGIEMLRRAATIAMTQRSTKKRQSSRSTASRATE